MTHLPVAPRFRRLSPSLVTSACALALVLAERPNSHADTTTITAAKDTTLYADDGNLSNGSGSSFIAGATASGITRRALVYFDVAAALPAGSSIDAVTLRLRLAQTQAGDTDVAIHALTAGFGESTSNANAGPGQGAPAEPGDATWTHRVFDTDAWTTPGADFAASPSAVAAVGAAGQSYDWTAAGLVADVQTWLDAPASNFGWVIIGEEGGFLTAKRFDSRESPLPERHPVIEVEFTPPAATGACCAGDGTCTLTNDPGTSCPGDYQGLGTGCDPNLCPAASGACCLPVAAATCVETTAGDCGTQGGTFEGDATACLDVTCPVVLEPFVDPLPRVAAAVPVSGNSGGAASYDIAIRQVSQQLHRDLPPTTVWGYGDGASGAIYPGPTIVAAVGETVTVRWINDLRDSGSEPLTDHLLPVDPCPHGAHDPSPRIVTHLHGGHVPAEFDGYPEDTLHPGEEATYVYPNDQPGATLWYHDHALGITRLNVYLGLAGFYVLSDPAEAALGLPDGDYDIGLVIQDRTFRPDGELAYPELWTEHFFGDTAVVNGKVWPYLDVDQGQYRFRLLNGSNSRTYTLALSNAASFVLIAGDGGLLDAPVTLGALTLSPGERAEIVVDFSPYADGTEIVLENSAPAPFTGSSTAHPVVHDGEPAALPHLMKFVVGSAAGFTAPLPGAFTPLERLEEVDAVVTRDFELAKGADACTGSAWLINGLRWDDITEYPRLGTTEIWRFINPSGVMHPMHMHLVMFQVLDRQPFEEIDGEIVPTGPAMPPSPEETGWKDTVQVAAREIVRVIARFEDYKGRFAYHCHIIEHEDQEMMRQFETVDCGDAVVDFGEACDLGEENGDGATCCSADCELASAGTSCADDGDVCTDDACNGTLVCGHVFDPANAEVCDGPCGDANDDDRLTATDALIALNTTMDAGACPPSICDVNLSGEITATDALAILRVAVGLPSPLECLAGA
jgi:spore coat protein A